MIIASETKFCAGLYYNAEELKIWEIYDLVTIWESNIYGLRFRELLHSYVNI